MKGPFSKAKGGITSSAILGEGMLIFGSKDWSLYAVEAEAGWQVWKFRMGGATISTPAYSEGRIYTAGGEGRVYAVRSEEHTSELQSHLNIVCRLLLAKNHGTSSILIVILPLTLSPMLRFNVQIP